MSLIKKVDRKSTKIKIGISGSSGSGKTYSAILIAKGLVPAEKILFIDSENGVDMYQDTGISDKIEFNPPYSLSKLKEYIELAIKEGYQCVIIDSMTHCWSGEGGILEEVERLTNGKYKGFGMQAWKEITPIYRSFLNYIAKCPLHVIVTFRSKTEYSVEKNDSGKNVVRKLGLKEEFRDGIDYEFSMFMNMDQSHMAHVSKDRTRLFTDTSFTPSEATGAAIKEWCESGSQSDMPSQEEIKLLLEILEKNGHKDENSAKRAKEEYITMTRERVLKAIKHFNTLS